MINRRHFVGALALSGIAVIPAVIPAAIAPAYAAVGAKFSAEAFEAAQKADKSIVLFVHAAWCPTCRVQESILAKLMTDKKYAGIAIFVVDFDSEKAVLRRFKASQQSTLIGFKGGRETKRSSGDTELMTIEDLLETTL